MSRPLRAFAMMLAFSALLLAGCATPGGYGYPDGYGYPGQGYPDQGYPAYGAQLYGTVEGIDPGRARILLDVGERNGRMMRREVRYDRNTRLFYRGQQSAVEGLERGDVVRIEVVESGRELWARSIEVVHNVREGGYGGAYGPAGDLRGSVAWVDTRARLIRLDSAGYGSGTQLAYDDRTIVEYRGRRYRPTDLQRGDQVSVRARQVGNGQWLAERITVERSARD